MQAPLYSVLLNLLCVLKCGCIYCMECPVTCFEVQVHFMERPQRSPGGSLGGTSGSTCTPAVLSLFCTLQCSLKPVACFEVHVHLLYGMSTEEPRKKSVWYVWQYMRTSCFTADTSWSITSCNSSTREHRTATL